MYTVLGTNAVKRDSMVGSPFLSFALLYDSCRIVFCHYRSYNLAGVQNCKWLFQPWFNQDSSSQRKIVVSRAGGGKNSTQTKVNRLADVFVERRREGRPTCMLQYVFGRFQICKAFWNLWVKGIKCFRHLTILPLNTTHPSTSSPLKCHIRVKESGTLQTNKEIKGTKNKLVRESNIQSHLEPKHKEEIPESVCIVLTEQKWDDCEHFGFL